MNTPGYICAIFVLFSSIFHKSIAVSLDVQAEDLNISVGKLKLKFLKEECTDAKTDETSHTRAVTEISDGPNSTEIITKDITPGEIPKETAYTGMTSETNSTEIPDVEVKVAPRDCSEVKEAGNNISGIYTVFPSNTEINSSIEVYCDMETDGGGWTVIQRRGNYSKPKDYFYRTWKEYKIGFGDISEDFWLGNDNIHALTNQGNCSLRVDMKDWKGNTAYAYYGEFWIGNERHLYELHVSGYSGTAGDSLEYHNGMKFSTKDMDNDLRNGNCAETYRGAWWYNKCFYSNLNGIYLDGVSWFFWKNRHFSLREVDMKIRSA